MDYIPSKPEIQFLTAEQLNNLLEEHNILRKIHTNMFREVEQDHAAARIAGGGRSLIISYYEGNQYICTKHKILTASGKLFHQDIEDALINGIRYKKVGDYY